MALEGEDGAIRWQEAVSPTTTPPTMGDEEVIFGTTERIQAFDAADGNRAWSTPVDVPLTEITIDQNRLLGIGGDSQRHPIPDADSTDEPRLAVHEIPGGTLVTEVEYDLDEQLPPVSVGTAGGDFYLSDRQWLYKLTDSFLEGE